MKRSTASPTGCGGAAFTWDCCSGRWPSGWASPLPFYIDMETGVCEHTPAAVMDRLVGPIRRPGDRPAGMATIAFCMRDRPGRFWPFASGRVSAAPHLPARPASAKAPSVPGRPGRRPSARKAGSGTFGNKSRVPRREWILAVLICSI